jgi:hypothetical protein
MYTLHYTEGQGISGGAIHFGPNLDFVGKNAKVKNDGDEC